MKNIVHVTDIHTNLPRITQLVEWIIENKVM